MENIKKWLRINKNKIFRLIVLLGGIFGFIGCFQYYYQVIPFLPKVISASLFGTIKLFAFIPPLGFEKDTSLLYEIARWLAPLGTVLGFFSVFGNLYNKVRIWARSRYASPYIVIGSSDNAVTLLHNLVSEDPSDIGFLLTDEIIDENKENELLNVGARSENLSLQRDPSELIVQVLKSIKIVDSSVIILYENDIKNFSNLKELNSYLPERKKAYKIIFIYVNDSIKDMIEEEIDNFENLNVRFLKVEDLLVNDLLQRGFDLSPPIKKTYSKDELNPDSLSDIMGNIHVCIIGFNKLGQSILLEVLNTGVANLRDKIVVTLVDKNLRQKYGEFKSQYKNLDKMVEINFIEADIKHVDFQDKIEEINAKQPIYNLFYAIRDEEASLISLNNLRFTLPKARVAIRTENLKDLGSFVRPLSKYYDSIILFGSDDQVLNRKMVLETDLAARAKKFNYDYNLITSNMMGYDMDDKDPDEAWMDLNTLKKESSINQAAHKSTKISMLERLIDLGILEGTIEENLETWEKKIIDKDVSEQVNIIEADPVMNYLTAIEHKRWCNFYYLKNFKYGKPKDEANLIHDSLIYDWQDFMASDQRDKAIFDFLSVLNI